MPRSIRPIKTSPAATKPKIFCPTRLSKDEKFSLREGFEVAGDSAVLVNTGAGELAVVVVVAAAVVGVAVAAGLSNIPAGMGGAPAKRAAVAESCGCAGGYDVAGTESGVAVGAVVALTLD